MRLRLIHDIRIRRLDQRARPRREKPEGRGRGGRVFLRRGFEDAVNPGSPEYPVVFDVGIPAAHMGNGLRGIQQHIKPLARRLRLHVVRHIREGAHHASAWQGMGFDLQRAPCQGHTQIVLRELHLVYFSRSHQKTANLGFEQVRVGTEIASFILEPGDFLGGGTRGKKALRQIQQLAGPAVESADPTHGIQHENALADTGQRGLQQAGFLQQLLVQRTQRGLGLLTLADVRVGAYHAQRPAAGVAADHHAARQNPLPGAILAAQAQVNCVVGCAPLQVGRGCGLHLGQVVRVDPIGEFMVARADFIGCITEHFFPPGGVRLLARRHIPVPDAFARAFQRQLPGILASVALILRRVQSRRAAQWRWWAGLSLGWVFYHDFDSIARVLATGGVWGRKACAQVGCAMVWRLGVRSARSCPGETAGICCI